MRESRELERLLRRLPRYRAPTSLWEDIQEELRETPRTRIHRPRRAVRPWLVAASLLAAMAGGGAIGIVSTYGAPRQWAVIPLAGTPAVGDAPLTNAGAVTVGEWLVTDSRSRARLSVGRIGVADIGPDSRVRIGRAGFTAHRLTVERGSLHAVIDAPPRLFFVQTPTALATDLGCAYTLEVDATGATRLHVTAGWVELREADVVSLVPAGLVAEVARGGRPGVPYPEELPDSARAALRRLDGGVGDSLDLDRVLAAQYTPTHNITLRRRSAVTLWHLMQRVAGAARAQVYDHLAALSPPPARVTREGILALDRRMLERWRADLSPMWSEEAQPWPNRIARRLWNLVIR